MCGLHCIRSIAALFNRAIVFTRIGDDASAVKDLDAAALIESTDPDIFHNRGMIHRRNVGAVNHLSTRLLCVLACWGGGRLPRVVQCAVGQSLADC